MEWTDIIALINAGNWERARQEIDSLKGKTAWNDTARNCGVLRLYA